MKNMFGNYREKDVMKVRTELVKRPLIAFDKDTNIKILTTAGEYKMYEIDNEKGEFIEKGGKLLIME